MVPGRGERRGVRIQGEQGRYARAGLFQKVLVKRPGRYLGIVWVKRVGENPASHVSLQLLSPRIHEETRELERRSSRGFCLAAPTTEWQPLMVYVDAPFEPVRLYFLLKVEGGDAIFSDAALYSIPAGKTR